MTELTSALASALMPSMLRLPSHANAMRTLAYDAPVFQPTAVPQSLDVTAYAGALSPGNPGGSETALAAFRQLVDPVPGFARYYAPSGSSTESLWSSLLTASVKAGNGFTQQMLSDAARTFASTALAGLTLSEANWHAVYPVEPDWTQLDQQSWTRITIDPDASTAGNGAYRLIGAPSAQPALQWQGGADMQASPLAAGTRLKSISFEAFAVTLDRPWINPALFKAAGLYLAGQAAGFYSSGLLGENDGVLPLLPTGFFVARNVTVSGTWDSADRARLRTAAAAGSRLTLGHFLLASATGRHPSPVQFSDDTVSSSAVQVVAWISTLVPRFPQIDGTALA